MRKNPTMGIRAFSCQCFSLKNVFVPRSDMIWDIRSIGHRKFQEPVLRLISRLRSVPHLAGGLEGL